MTSHEQLRACGPVPAGYVTVPEAARRLKRHPRAIEWRIDKGYLTVEIVYVPVQVISEAELCRQQQLHLRSGRPAPAEPDKETNYAAWKHWERRQRRNAAARRRSAESRQDSVPEPCLDGVEGGGGR